MRPLIQYYEALEAQALWDGDIALTALVALFDQSIEDAVQAAAEASTSPIVVDLAPTSSWSLGGLIVTAHMVYVIAFDNEEDGEGDSQTSHSGGGHGDGDSSSRSVTPTTRSKGIDSGSPSSSPQHAFEQLLSRLPPFHVVVEDVLESITGIELVEHPPCTPSFGVSASPGNASAVTGAVVVALHLLSQEVRFVLKSPVSFDNVDLQDVVHAFGVLPHVEVVQRVLQLTGNHSRSAVLASPSPPSSPPDHNGAGVLVHRATPPRMSMGDGGVRLPAHSSVCDSRKSKSYASTTTASTSNSAAPQWDQEDDPVVLELMSVSEAESEARVRLVEEACFAFSSTTHFLYRDTVQRLLRAFEEALAARREVDNSTNEISVSGCGSQDEELTKLLDSYERNARSKLGKYRTATKDKAGVSVLEAERAVTAQRAQVIIDLAEQETQRVLREMREKEVALHEAQRKVQELAAERDDLKQRENLVIERARMRENELHAQLRALRERTQA